MYMFVNLFISPAEDVTRDDDIVATMAARDECEKGAGRGGGGGRGGTPRRRLSKNLGWTPIAQHGLWVRF